MLLRVVPILVAIVALFATLTSVAAMPFEAPVLGGAAPTFTPTVIPTSTTIVAPTITSTLTVAAPSVTSTLSATVLPFADLSVSMTTTVSGGGTSAQQITHNIEVRNLGSVATTLSTVLAIPIPQGATFAFANGCNPPDAAGNVSCTVPTLQPGGTATYQVIMNSTGSNNQIVTVANLDPGIVISNDVNRNNNTAVVVTPVAQTTFQTGVPTATFIPTSTSITITPIVTVVVITATPVPGAPTPTATSVPVPTQPTTGGFQWIRILAPTEAVSTENEVLWIAQPGELYYVVREEGGWVLAIWEGDTPFWQVWIQLDARVQQLTLDRPGPGATIGQIWLVVFSPTDAYTVTMDPAWVANPGEWYRVVSIEADWALAVWEGDPPDVQVWIQIDNRVEITVLDLPGPTGRL
jgi:hypothetical protein